MIFSCRKSTLLEMLEDEGEIKGLFRERFGNNFQSFWKVFQEQCEIKYGELSDDKAREFINMIDTFESKSESKVDYLRYDRNENKILFYDKAGNVIATCECKNGWIAESMRRDKFNLNEDLNEDNQISISFPLIVTYESENKDISKDGIEGYDDLEKECIQEYADAVVKKVEENKKYINEVLGTYDFELKYDGYDDNFNVFFVLTTEKDDLVDETVLKAFKRYFNDEYQYEKDMDDNRVLLTATPVAVLNSNFQFERI